MFDTLLVIRLFEILKMFYPQTESAIAHPNVVHLTPFRFIMVQGRVFGVSKTQTPTRLFEILKMFYPREGAEDSHLLGPNKALFSLF